MQTLHSYIRRELTCCQINRISRFEIKKMIQDIETIEFVLIHLKKNDNDHKTSDFDSKRRRIQNNMSLKNILVAAFIAFVAFSRFTNNRRLDQSKKIVLRKKNFSKIENSKARHFKISSSHVITVTA